MICDICDVEIDNPIHKDEGPERYYCEACANCKQLERIDKCDACWNKTKE